MTTLWDGVTRFDPVRHIRAMINGETIPVTVDEYPDGQVRLGVHRDVDRVLMSCPNSMMLDLAFQLENGWGVLPDAIYSYGGRSDKVDDTHRCNVSRLMPSRVALTKHSGHSSWHPIFKRRGTTVYPDESAARRSIYGPGVVAKKKRNQESGEIISYDLESLPVGEYTVIDDLCDGGRTFIECAKALPAGCSLHLCVTHGVFSGNAPALLDYYQTIQVTNSLPQNVELFLQRCGEDSGRVDVIDVWHGVITG